MVIENFNHKGFQIIENIYSKSEIDSIVDLIKVKNIENKFGVRNFLIDHPEFIKTLFNDNLIQVLKIISPDNVKAIKSIYFDKPPSANWNVNWHQDLTINLKAIKEIPQYKNWRKKDNRITVQPDIKLLKNIFTVRIHLDDCKKENGALRVIEGSHLNGIIEIKDWIKSKKGIKKICEVNKGGILLMKPLILHSSKRTENYSNRRVIHIEFTNKELPEGLEWSERINIDN